MLIVPSLISLLLPTATLYWLGFGTLLHPCALRFMEEILSSTSSRSGAIWASETRSLNAKFLAQKAPASKTMSLLLIVINAQKLNWLLYFGEVSVFILKKCSYWVKRKVLRQHDQDRRERPWLSSRVFTSSYLCYWELIYWFSNMGFISSYLSCNKI